VILARRAGLSRGATVAEEPVGKAYFHLPGERKRRGSLVTDGRNWHLQGRSRKFDGRKGAAGSVLARVELDRVDPELFGRTRDIPWNATQVLLGV
jgi:hypothetical protein